MEEREAVFVAILGHGQAQEKLDLNTKVRILHGLARIRELEGEGVRVSGIIFMAGVGTVPSKETMATKMASYAEPLMAADEVLLTISPIVNHGNDKVWGTLLEMKWAHERVKKICRRPFRIEFVTNRRHGRRVIVANYLLTKILNIGVEVSNDAPHSLIHEGLGYLKLLTYFLHLDKPAEALRRKFYHR